MNPLKKLYVFFGCIKTFMNILQCQFLRRRFFNECKDDYTSNHD